MYFTLTTHLDSDAKFSSAKLHLPLCFVASSVEKVDLRTQVVPNVLENFAVINCLILNVKEIRYTGKFSCSVTLATFPSQLCFNHLFSTPWCGGWYAAPLGYGDGLTHHTRPWTDETDGGR